MVVRAIEFESILACNLPSSDGFQRIARFNVKVNPLLRHDSGRQENSNGCIQLQTHCSAGCTSAQCGLTLNPNRRGALCGLPMGVPTVLAGGFLHRKNLGGYRIVRARLCLSTEAG